MDARQSFHLNSNHDDRVQRTAKADRSHAVAIPYVTPLNDNVPTSSGCWPTTGFASSFSCRAITASDQFVLNQTPGTLEACLY